MSEYNINICMLGNPKILFNNTEITSKLSTKSIGLLCYISTNDNISREKLAYMFWEDSNSDAAKYNLRYNLWVMNKYFKNNSENNVLFNFKNNKIFFNDRYKIHTDIADFNNMFSNEENFEKENALLKLKTIYRSDFLDGFYLKGCLKFNDWAFYAKEKYQKKYINVLQKLLKLYQKEKRYEYAVQIIEDMMEINSYNEDLYVELIKIYLEMGDRISALKQYNRCVHILREELNIAPKESTEKYLRIIKDTKYLNKKAHQYSRQKSNIINITNNQFTKLKLEKSSLKIKCILQCIPIDSVNYNFLTQLVDDIIDKFDLEKLESVDKNLWIDIQRINIKAKKFINTSSECLTIETERNRIYYSMFQLIKELFEDNPFQIIIDKLHFMDRYSFDFIKYLLFRKDELNIQLLFTCNNSDSKYLELKQYFQIERSV